MRVLGQPGFFDLDDCYAELSRNGDPLEALEARSGPRKLDRWLRWILTCKKEGIYGNDKEKKPQPKF